MPRLGYPRVIYALAQCQQLWEVLAPEAPVSLNIVFQTHFVCVLTSLYSIDPFLLFKTLFTKSAIMFGALVFFHYRIRQ